MTGTINYYWKRRIPFIFLVDFNMKQWIVRSTAEISADEILYDFNGFTNAGEMIPKPGPPAFLKKRPVPFSRYLRSFEYITDLQRRGFSYLANLTFPTEIETNLTLKEIFYLRGAKYRLWYRDRFAVFSPEPFITVENGMISSFPMKGTIDASIPEAERIVRENEKESAEHLTIVDLIRNDLNMVARDVTVERYRYIERIQTSGKDLFQVSSRITGRLLSEFLDDPEGMLVSLLPAGSVTGAPKAATVRMIREAEGYDRGFYTGICGCGDGTRLDCGVMIRFIEKIDGRLFFKSGGGITVYSDVRDEYREMVDKVYVPAH